MFKKIIATSVGKSGFFGGGKRIDDGQLIDCCVCLVIYFGPIFGCVFWYVYSPSGVGWCVHS